MSKLLGDVLAGMDNSLKSYGFSGAKDITLQQEGDSSFAEISGSKGDLRLEHEGVKLILTTSDEATPLMVTLLDPETADKNDVQSAARECSEALRERFGKKSVKQNKGNPANKTVSAAQAKAGLAAFDANTLANRLTALFPALRAAYDENLKQNGEFFAEEFFKKQGGAKPILDAINRRDKQKLKRLFNMLNDIYENGNADVQSVIAVTILGQLNNDEEKIADIIDFMCDDMKTPVIYVNRFLATAKGKRYLKKMENPPKYKPPKQKKSFLSEIMAAGQAGQPQAPMPF